MKTHLGWIRVTATAAMFASVGAMPAAAQYAPYRPLTQQTAQPVSSTPQPVAAQRVAPQAPVQQARPATAAPTTQTPYVAWQMSQGAAPHQPSVDRYQTATTQYPQTTAPYVPSAPYVPATASVAPAASAYPVGYPTYPAVARQPEGPTPTADEQMPAPQQPANGGETTGYNGYANGAGNGQANGLAGNGYYNSTGNCDCDQGYTGVSDYFGDSCHQTQWFGGVYFLFMERDNPTPTKLAVEVDHSIAADPYYPHAGTSRLGTNFIDYDYRAGAEVRFGSTFTIGDSCEPCNSGCYGGCNSCAPCASDLYAWEVAWWGLDDDADTYTYVQNLPYPRRMYGMKNFHGLEYDRDGAGAGFAYRRLNDYYGYQLPIPDPGAGPYADGYIAVLAQRVRTNFKAQNLELNIVRFPVCQVACGGCNSGCDPCGCEDQCCPSAFSMYGACGVRYFRVDDDFMYANEFAEWAGGVADMPSHDGFYDGQSNELYYDVQVENHLVGPQVGWTMNYNYACRWNFFCNSTFGVFNNHVNHVQRLWGGGGGDVRFVESGENFYVESDKNDLSFLGELRLGGSYDISCNWRAVLAYRAVAIAGLATSTDQIPDEFTNPEWVAIIDSDNSMIIHGVQVGAECRY